MLTLRISQRTDHRHHRTARECNRRLQHSPLRDNHRPLNYILQFADIAGPMIVFESFYYIVGNVVDYFALLLRERSNEVRDE